MIKKFLSTLILTVLLTTLVSAQEFSNVNLKNGSVIRGKIERINPAENISVTDAAGNKWVFAMDEVESIEPASEKVYNNYGGLAPGLVNITTIGFLAGAQNSNYIAPFTIQTSVGYMLESGIYTGLLTGLEFLNISHIPVMFDFQYLLRNGEVSPYLVARGGYAIPSKSYEEMYGTTYTYSGGPAGAVGIGLKIRSRDIMAWDVSVLYRYMRISYKEKYQYNDQVNAYTDVYNRLELRVGFYIGK